MNYFIDFEATQFTNEIIAVGCVRDDGEVFYSLVKPTHKITNFITNLTGITREDLATAPSADEVFTKFFDWINGDNNIQFYCYGDADKGFALGTLKYTSSFYAKAALGLIATNLIDYQIILKERCRLAHCIKLIKAVNAFQGHEVEQTHDALEDAQFLRYIKECIDSQDYNLFTLFPDDIINIKQTDIALAKGIQRMKYGEVCETYSNIDDAADWILHQIPEEQREEVKPKNLKKHLRQAITKKQKYWDYKWKIIV